MTESLPLWFWVPLATLLWGYLILDTLIRRYRKATMLTIVIARTVREGRQRFPDAVAVVTPRSADAARGLVADRVVILDNMRDHHMLDKLRREAAPCLLFGAGGARAYGALVAARDATPGSVWVSPAGTQWTVTRRWTSAGRLVIVAVQSAAGAIRHLSAEQVERDWRPA